jgi:hypothetical protein
MTTDKLQFHTVSLDRSLFEDLQTPVRCLTRPTIALLQVAFSHGGYIAGGFGAILARHYLLKSTGVDSTLFGVIRNHCGLPRRRPDPFSMYGDIDVWFPDSTALRDCLADTRYVALSQQLKATPTPSGAAIEYIIEGDVRVQFITRWLMPMREQIERFDIYNAMVGVTEHTITVPSDWQTLEELSMLHVVNWMLPLTINRTFKWIRRKGYQQVTPAVASHLYDEVFKAIEWSKSASVPKCSDVAGGCQSIHTEEFHKELTSNKLRAVIFNSLGKSVQVTLRPILKQMTNEQLLQLSALFNCSIDYNLAMKEIHKRTPVG